MTATILIVDNDERLVAALRSYLEDCGYDTEAAFDGAGIVHTATYKKASLIILDVDMPFVGGLQALQLLRADPKTRNIPVILLSAVTSSQVYPAISKLPLTTHVKKPVEPEDLISIIRHYLRKPD